MRANDHPGYLGERLDTGEMIARADAADFVRSAIATAGSLYEYARRAPGAETLQGRQPVFVIPAPGHGRWVVRQLSHGGLLAPLTGDRFLRVGTPRPFNELRTSRRLRELGILTPAVVAAVVYPAGLFYRGEVAREEIPDSSDLAACLFGAPPADARRRIAALTAAGRLLRRLHAEGIVHPDLNLRNVLIQDAHGEPRAYILDVEKCRVVPRVGPYRRRRMLKRFERSARKFEGRTGARVGEQGWRAFYRAYDEDDAGGRG